MTESRQFAATPWPHRSGLEQCDHCRQDIYWVDRDDILSGSKEREGWHLTFNDDGTCSSPESADGHHLCSNGRE